MTSPSCNRDGTPAEGQRASAARGGVAACLPSRARACHPGPTCCACHVRLASLVWLADGFMSIERSSSERRHLFA